MWPAMHRTVLVADVEGFGQQRRTNPQRLAIRDALYTAMCSAFERAHIRWGKCYREDRGDGMFVLASANTPKFLFVDALPKALLTALREHNYSCHPHERVRLRLALHAGEISYDEHGVTAAAINLAFRLVNCSVLRHALATSSGDLALITSSWFFDEVVRNCATYDPGDYWPAEVQVKETTAIGWIHVPSAAAGELAHERGR